MRRFINRLVSQNFHENTNSLYNLVTRIILQLIKLNCTLAVDINGNQNSSMEEHEDSFKE